MDHLINMIKNQKEARRSVSEFRDELIRVFGNCPVTNNALWKRLK